MKIGNLEELRKLAKNKTQLRVIENLYNQIGHTKKMIHSRLEESQAFKLAELYPDIFKIVWRGNTTHLDFKEEE